MTSRAAALAVAALGLLAPACGSSGSGGSPPATTGTAPPDSGPAPTRAPSPTPVPGSLATYTRSGGLAGVHVEVVVRPDGTFEGGTGKPGRGRLGNGGLDDLRSLVAAFVAAAPQPSYGEPSPDAFVTSVAAGGASTTVLGGATPPPPVQRLVSFLAALERQLPR